MRTDRVDLMPKTRVADLAGRFEDRMVPRDVAGILTPDEVQLMTARARAVNAARGWAYDEGVETSDFDPECLGSRAMLRLAWAATKAGCRRFWIEVRRRAS